MMDFEVLVPHKEMSKERHAECCDLMIEGNTAFRRWLPYFSRKRSKIARRAIIKGELNEVLQHIPSEKRGEFLADIPVILKVETVMTDVISHHVKMVVRLANRWAKTNRDNKSRCSSHIDGHDIASEGFLALVDAIHNYDRASIQLLTYVWTAVNRRMLESLMITSPMVFFSREERSLLKKVREDQRKSGRNKSLSEVVKDGVINASDVGIVTEMLSIKVLLASSVEHTLFDRDTEDYTSLRAGTKDGNANRDSDAWELYDLIERAELSDLEQDVLLSSMTPVCGWQVACAKRHFRNGSEKHLSKTAVGLALSRACSKIRRVAGVYEETNINLATEMKRMMAS